MSDAETFFNVYSNYTDDFAWSYNGEKLTEAGKRRFATALGLRVENVNHLQFSVTLAVDSPEASRDLVKIRQDQLKELFDCMAGYCSVDDWAEWFFVEG